MSASDAEKTNFERQRDALIQEIVVSFDQVLSNLNHLNRSLEGVSAIGREFENVEALWSQFDTVLSQRQPKDNTTTTNNENDDNEDNNNNNSSTPTGRVNSSEDAEMEL